MLDRIRQLLADRQLSPTQFADAIGVSRPVISHILSGRNKPSLEVVQKILGAFPDISVSWLLNGTGPMKSAGPAERAADAPRRRAAPEPAPVVAHAQEPLTTPLKASADKSDADTPLEGLQRPEEPKTDPTVNVPSVAADPEPRAGAAPATADPAPAATRSPQTTSSQPVGADWAQALAEPGKVIRRIVIFYQDGTFADYQPEAPHTPAKR